MKKAMDLMSKPEKVIRYDVTCTGEDGDIVKKDTMLSSASVTANEFCQFWLEAFADNITGDFSIEVKSSTETVSCDYKHGVGVLKQKRPRKRVTEQMIREFTEKYGEFIDEIDLSDEALDPKHEDELVMKIFDALNDKSKVIGYTMNCVSDFTGKSIYSGKYSASSSMSPVDVLKFWLDQNASNIHGDCVATISVRGKERARMNYEAVGM